MTIKDEVKKVVSLQDRLEKAIDAEFGVDENIEIRDIIIALGIYTGMQVGFNSINDEELVRYTNLAYNSLDGGIKMGDESRTAP